MTDHVKAAHSLEAPILMIHDASNHLDAGDIERISRLRHVVRQLEHQAEELRLLELKVIKGDKP